MNLSEITKKLFSSNYSKQEEGAPLEPIKDSRDQGLDEKKLVEHVKSKIDLVRSTNSRVTLEGIYLTNVAYLMGFDGVYFDTTNRQFRNIDPKRKFTRSRFKVNKILPIVQNRLSRLTQSPPRFDVRPNSNSTEDKDSARLSLELIENIIEKQTFNERRQDLLMSTMQGGVAYAQALWDPCLGKPMVDPDSGELSGYEGDVRIEILNCLEVFPDPLAKNIEECQWIIKAKVRKLEYFRERYPERGDAVKEEDSWLLSSVYDLKSNALTSVGIAGASAQDQMKNAAIELVYYEKRSTDYPNGRMVVCSNGVLLEDKELPIGQYDIVKFDDMLIGSRYNSEAIITHLRPVQDQYNVTRAKTSDWVQKLLGGKYIVAKGANLTQEAINDSSGEVIQYTPVPNASEPKSMDIPQIPPYVYKDLQQLDQELDYISGINEISRGVLPSASIPASGMAFLQEQDQTRIGVMTSRNENGYAKLFGNVLRYVGKYYEMPRLLKTAGDGLEYAVKDFVGADLRNNFDVIVIPGSSAPSSKVLKRQDILNSYQMGILGNPMDDKLKAKVLKMLEFGDVAEMWKTQALDGAQVKKNIEMIEQGKQPEISQFDNHQTHLMEMNDYRKGDKFQQLDLEKQKLFMFVMNQHINSLVDLANPNIANQKMMAEMAIKQNPQATNMMVNNIHQMHPGSPMNQGQPQVQVDAQGNPVIPTPQPSPIPGQPVPGAQGA